MPSLWSLTFILDRSEKPNEIQISTDGLVIAIDLVPLRPVFEPPGCRFIQGDITSPQTMDQIRDILQARNTKVAREKLKVDAVISDMAPHSSGIEITDRTRQIVGLSSGLSSTEKRLGLTDLTQPTGTLLRCSWCCAKDA